MDTVSIAIMALLILVVNGSVVTLLAIRLPDFPGLRIWALSIWIMLAGTFLFMLRLINLQGLSIALGNLLMFTGLYLPIVGLSQFTGRKINVKLDTTLIVVTTLALLFFYFAMDKFQIRVVIGATLLNYFSFKAVRLVYSEKRWPMTLRIFIAGYSTLFLIQSVRIFDAVFLQYSSQLFDTSIIANLTFIFTLASTWFYTYGMIIATTEEKERQLEKLSEEDVLTKIDNRIKMESRLKSIWDQHLEQNRNFSVILFEINNFRNFSEQYGRDQADHLLVDIVSKVKPLINNGEYFSRWSDDNFLVLIPDVLLPQAQALAESVRATINRKITRQHSTISTSFGLICSEGEIRELKTLINLVDYALSEARERGENKIEIAEI